MPDFTFFPTHRAYQLTFRLAIHFTCIVEINWRVFKDVVKSFELYALMTA